MGGIITDTERLLTSSEALPLAEGDGCKTTSVIQAPKSSSFRILAIICALLLSVVAVITHASAVLGVIKYMEEMGAKFLFSFILPDCAISKPSIPSLPKGELMEEEDKEESKKPVQLLYRDEDLSAKAENGFVLSNETDYSPDLQALHLQSRAPLTFTEIDESFGTGCPKVLIYHTHATEAYKETDRTSFRTTNCESNMVAIGELMAKILRDAGIETLHLTKLFDEKDWSSSYANSSAAVREILEKYPSIQYVFDLHRDCIGDEENGYVQPTSNLYGTSVAQIMTVIGTDEGGSGHSTWRDNLSFALSLQSSLWNSYDGFVRPINLRRASFYQDTRAGAALFEIGTCANTLAEAKRACVLLSCALADYIYGFDINMDEEYLLKTLCP